GQQKSCEARSGDLPAEVRLNEASRSEKCATCNFYVWRAENRIAVEQKSERQETGDQQKVSLEIDSRVSHSRFRAPRQMPGHIVGIVKFRSPNKPSDAGARRQN